MAASNSRLLKRWHRSARTNRTFAGGLRDFARQLAEASANEKKRRTAKAWLQARGLSA